LRFIGLEDLLLTENQHTLAACQTIEVNRAFDNKKLNAAYIESPNHSTMNEAIAHLKTTGPMMKNHDWKTKVTQKHTHSGPSFPTASNLN